jgi:hypothetical protein
MPNSRARSVAAALAALLATAYSQYYPDVKFDDVVRVRVT